MALTFDDLPCAGPCGTLETERSITERLLAALAREKAPAVGFVIGGQLDRVPAERQARIALLERWRSAGHLLGNHTYSHPDLNTMRLELFKQDVVNGEPVVRKLMGGSGKLYFRHPFTHTGGSEAKKSGFEGFLRSRGYEIAPFTLECADWVYNSAFVNAVARRDTEMQDRLRKAYVEHFSRSLDFVERVSRDLFGRDIPQVVLLHANAVNADQLPVLLELARKRGYKFVSLADALRDPAYATRDLYSGPGGPPWLARWQTALGKKVAMNDDPEPPDWVEKAARN